MQPSVSPEVEHFDPGQPSKDVEVHIRWIRKALPNGALLQTKPTLEVIIPSPLLHGKRPDWKATAHAVGQKYLHTRHKWSAAVDMLKESDRTNTQLRGALFLDRDKIHELQEDKNAYEIVLNAVLELSWFQKLLIPARLLSNIANVLEAREG